MYKKSVFSFFSLYKKAISPIIGVILMITLTVIISVSIFQLISSYSEDQLEGSENNLILDEFSIRLVDANSQQILFQTTFDELNITQVLLDGFECDGNEGLVLGRPLRINVSSCSQNITTSRPRLIIQTEDGIIQRDLNSRDLGVTPSSVNEVVSELNFIMPMNATGGFVEDIQYQGTWYRVHRFTNAGSFDAFQILELHDNTYFYVAVIGGGGGGGARSGSGGGAGGVAPLQNGIDNRITAQVGVHNLYVPLGGQGALNTQSASSGQNGVFILNVTHNITAIGGGPGHHCFALTYPVSTSDGGSGGGAGGGCGSEIGVQGMALQPSSIWGGHGNSGSQVNRGGGGGAMSTSNSVNGGNGINILGDFYAGGGAGHLGEGGSGVGGDGRGVNPSNIQGAPNTGSGGGGGISEPFGERPGGAGGSGIIIVWYPLNG